MGSGLSRQRAVMGSAHQLTPLPQRLGIPVSDWQQTPMTVRDEFLYLLQRVDVLEVRFHCDAETRNQERARTMTRIKA
jgi:hypothetical protein